MIQDLLDGNWRASAIFDVLKPPGVDVDEHLSELPEKLLWLADHCKGFRLLVVSPSFLRYFAAAAPDRTKFRKLDDTNTRGIILAGSWRGYEMFVDYSLGNGEAYLGDRLNSVIGVFRLANLGGSI